MQEVKGQRLYMYYLKTLSLLQTQNIKSVWCVDTAVSYHFLKMNAYILTKHMPHIQMKAANTTIRLVLVTTVFRVKSCKHVFLKTYMKQSSTESLECKVSKISSQRK